MTEYMVVLEGNSRPQNQAIAQNIEEKMEEMHKRKTKSQVALHRWLLLLNENCRGLRVSQHPPMLGHARSVRCASVADAAWVFVTAVAPSPLMMSTVTSQPTRREVVLRMPLGWRAWNLSLRT